MTMPELVVEPLPLERARLAFPLMRLVLPALTLEDWQGFARQVARGARHVPAGILVARRPDTPYLCGAVCFRRDLDPQSGAVLTAEHLVALDLLYPQAVVAALVRALDGLAVSLRCQMIRVTAVAARPDLARTLRDCGHRSAGIVLGRRTRS